MVKHIIREQNTSMWVAHDAPQTSCAQQVERSSDCSRDVPKSVNTTYQVKYPTRASCYSIVLYCVVVNITLVQAMRLSDVDIILYVRLYHQTNTKYSANPQSFKLVQRHIRRANGKSTLGQRLCKYGMCG